MSTDVRSSNRAALEAEYRGLQPLYQAYAEKLRSLICDLVKSKDLAIVQSEARAKEIDSLLDKVDRKTAKYRDPLRDITDLAGVRIITYYLEDLVVVGDLLQAEFDVDEERSVLKADGLAPDQFGYVSDHYILKLKDPRRGLGEWKAFADLTAEIQVRTATQHAWAAIQHRLGYKAKEELPRDVQRRLYRLSALFELADEQFSGARGAAERAHQQYVNDLQEGNLDVPINTASLSAYIEQSPVVENVLDGIRGHGVEVFDGLEPDERLHRDRWDLIRTLRRHDVTTLGDLNTLLTRWPDVSDKYGEYVRAFRRIGDHSFSPGGTAEDLLNVVVFLLVGDRVSADEVEDTYSEESLHAILEVLGIERSHDDR